MNHDEKRYTNRLIERNGRLAKITAVNEHTEVNSLSFRHPESPFVCTIFGGEGQVFDSP